jgi:serine/threonine-protein kinase HipA
MAESTVEVIVQMEGEDVLAGRLWSHRRRGTESATFAYDPDYLGRRGAYELDPALGFDTGPKQTPVELGMFGAFSDCAPDRWGRRLIARAERRRSIEMTSWTPPGATCLPPPVPERLQCVLLC